MPPERGPSQQLLLDLAIERAKTESAALREKQRELRSKMAVLKTVHKFTHDGSIPESFSLDVATADNIVGLREGQSVIIRFSREALFAVPTLTRVLRDEGAFHHPFPAERPLESLDGKGYSYYQKEITHALENLRAQTAQKKQ